MDNIINTTDTSTIFMNRHTGPVRSGCLIYRIVQIDVPIEYSSIDIFDADGISVRDTSYYSWSTDNVCYTDWVNYDTFTNLTRNLENDFYIRILISGSMSRLVLNGIDITCYSVCLDTTNAFMTQFCDNQQLFNPYNNLDCALLLQQQLSDSIVCMFGIPCYYFRVEADDDTVDYTFKEYVMHNVTSCKYTKLMIQDGMLPSSKPQMTEFDFDWENDWEVEMSKSLFAAAFGDTAFPKQRDLIYVPMLHRMYEVNSAYDEKNEGLMYRSTTWKLALVKYNDKDNVTENEYENVIDNLLINQYEKLWQDVEMNERERESGITQTDSPEFAANTLFNITSSDAVRAQITDDINIVAHQLNNGSTIVCRNAYIGQMMSRIDYQNTYCGDDFTLIMTLTLPSASDVVRYDSTTHRIMSFGEVSLDITTRYDKRHRGSGGRVVEYGDGEYTIKFNGMECTIPIINEQHTVMVMLRANRSNFVTDMTVVEQRSRTGGYVDISQNMMRFDFNAPIFSETSTYNNDFSTRRDSIVTLHPYGCAVCSFKLYNTYLSREEMFTEGIKYTTTDDRCIINDIVREITSTPGFNVR